jgi:hypothetical protein
MQPQILQEKPPYVMFETRSEEDRNATIAKGSYVGKDVDYAIITPFGSKDRIERIATEWFDHLKQQVREERFNSAWLAYYQREYEAFKSSAMLPATGYPLINWPGLSPSLCKQLLALNMRVVEDVAAMNEEAISRIGMGARSLKQRAIDFLAAAKDVGQVAEAKSALEVKSTSLEAEVLRLREELQAANRTIVRLQAQLGQMEGVSQIRAAGRTMADEANGISFDDLTKE